MKTITIDDTPFQEFSIPFEDDFITVTLNFRLGSWFMSVSYLDKSLNGIKLASAVLMLTGKNLPFDIVIDDKGSELDPFSVDSFSLGFFEFNLIERDELVSIRGFEVE
jgi:hypothetical protein